MNRKLLCSLVAALLVSCSISFGQTALATVTGTITDASGAVIANAPVELRNLETGQIYTAASSSTGNYSVTQLPVGDYDLTISSPGFKTFLHTKFHLAAAQTMREDVTLEVGQTTESVTVTAEASLLKTETTNVVQNVTLTQLNNLPVLAIGATNSGFRDPFAAVRLVPGIRYNNGSNIGAGTTSAVNQMVVNGTPSNTFQARLDGLTINPTIPRTLGAYMQTQPSVDAIEEVAIETSNFAAEYGTSGGAMFNMVTKSGTNNYHGSAYDYVTNEALNSHQPYTGIRNTVKQHDWGYTVGGPVWFPKLYDGRNKTFFFWSYEQFRNKNINTSNNTTVPIPAYREGDFSNLILQENRLITRSSGGTSVPVTDALGRQIPSGTIFDPATQRAAPNGVQVRDAFPGNKIPLDRFDPISVKVLALVPLPLGDNSTRQAGNNYQGQFDSSRRSGIPSIKFDQNMGTKGRMSIYYQDTHTKVPRTPTGADGFPDNITGSVSSVSSGQTIRLNYDYTVTPKLLLHLGAGWNDNDFGLEAAITNYDSFKELGLTGQTLPRYFPRLVVGANANTAIGGMSSLGQFFPDRAMERRPSGTASATYVAGSHTFKLGSDWRLEKGPRYLFGNTNGTYTFGDNMTEQPSLQGIQTNQGFDGFPLASFLLGGMSSNSQAAPIAQAYSKSQTALFLQDSWKVSRKLTLDYGLRWDYGTYAREQYGRNGSIGLAIPNPSAGGRLGAMQFEATCNCNFADNYKYAIGPRLGAAYQINTKTVLRGGFGVVYNSTSTAQGSFTSSASSTSFAANSGLITGLFKNGMPADVRAVWPSFNPGVGHGVGAVIAMPALLDRNAGRPARLLQWSVGIQRELNRNLVVEASYIANRGVWWTAPGLAPLNSISEATIRAYGFNDFTSTTEAALLTTTISSLTTLQRSTLAARGITGLPYSGYSTGQNVRQSLRDYPQYNSSGLAGAPLGNTWYDSLQITATQRFSHGLTFNINYNFSKNLELMSSPDVFNRRLGKNLSGNDRPHELRVTAQYQVPRLKDSGMAFVSNRFVSAILSDWGVGAYLSYVSAALVGRPSSNLNPNIGQFLGRGPGPAQLKIDPATGTYMNPWSVDWVDNSGTRRTDPIDINCHCFDPTKTIVLNPAAWENIPAGQWGAQQDSLRFFRGFRYPTENANFSRNFRIKEGINFNVRIEFNNVFNRMQLPFPNLGNFATQPTRFTTGPNAGLYSGGFGTIVPTSGTNGMRTGTLVGRLTF
jgi:hypothetical protein